MNNFFKFLFLSLYIVFIGEIGIRTISHFTNIYEIEMLKYAKKLKRSSENPNLSHEHIPNSQSQLMGVNIVLNSLGHRNNELQNEKANGEYRIHIIGSSITLGWGIETEKTFTSVLEKKLNTNEKIKKEKKSYVVVNGGIGNTNTTHHVELFKAQFNLINPDTVILQYFINDAEIIKKKKNNYILKYSYFIAFIYQHIKSYSFHGTLYEYYSDLYNENNLGWISAKNSILKLKDLCNENDISLIILFVPDFHDLSEKNPLTNLYLKITEQFNIMGIPIINSYESLSNEFKFNSLESWVSKDDAHPNSRAHSIIANDTYNFLIHTNLHF